MKKYTENQFKFITKVVSFALEILLYTSVFLALDSATVEVAVKAAIVLAVGIRFFLYATKK